MKFKVFVSKAYYKNGTMEVEADTSDEAYEIAEVQIEDFDAPLDRNKMDDMIEIEDDE